MNQEGLALRRNRHRLVVLACAVCLAGWPGNLKAEPCRIASHHEGVLFAVEGVGQTWLCRLQPIIEHYTTANKVGPLRTAMSESVYRYLLDRPYLAAALINRLEIGLHKSEPRGSGQFWGTDGEGTEGIIELVHQDGNSRIYYLEGTHHSRKIPNLNGKAVVFLRMTPVKSESGIESMDSTMVAYTKLDSRVLSGLAWLVRPLVSGIVTRKLTKGVDVVNRLGLEMRHHPERVMFEATDPPAFSEPDVVFLKEAIAFQPPTNGSTNIPKP